MDTNIKEEYQSLLDYVKEKISDNYLDSKSQSIYLEYIRIIEENVYKNATYEAYSTAIDLLLKTLDEIKKIDHSNADNYVELKENKEKEQAINKEKSDLLEHKINELEKSNSILKKKIRMYKCNVISYVLALSIFIGLPVGMYTKAKNTPKERLYKTYKEIHTTVDKEYEIMKPGYIYINANDVVKYTTSYEELLPYEETIEIKEYSPWITEGTESERKVVTILKDASSLDDKIYERDLSNLVLDYGTHQEYEYRYNVEIPYDDRQYTDKIYEITKLVQDTNDYIEKDLPISAYTDFVVVVLTELLFILCEIEMTENTILGHLIDEIIKLSNNKKISNIQRKKLNKLIHEYLNINKENSKIRKRNI